MIHYCMDLPAESVIIPVWDLLGEPETSRFNTPGTIRSLTGNGRYLLYRIK